MTINSECIICSSNYLKKLTLKGYSYSACQNCGLIFRNPLPSEVEDPNFIKDAGEYYLNYFLKSRDIKIEIDLQESRINQIGKYLNKLNNILEIGSGLGLFVKKCLDVGIKCISLEPSKSMYNFAVQELGLNDVIINEYLTHENLVNLTYKISDLFQKKQIDTVVSYHTLEHIKDFKVFFILSNIILRFGGIIAVEVPYIYSFDSLWNKTDWEALDESHLFYYTPESLKICSEKYGFEVIDVQYFISQIFYDRIKNYVSQFIENQWLIDKISRVFTGTSFLMIAKKVADLYDYEFYELYKNFL